jgi:hypothetical protein
MTSLQQKLKQMLDRSVAIHGTTYRQTEQGIVVMDAEAAKKEFMTQLCTLEPDPAEQCKMLIEAWEKGPDSDMMLSLNAVRVEQVANYIVSESVFMSAFFEQVTLQPDEEAYVVNETQNEIRVSAMGEDGHPDQVRILRPQSKVAIALAFLMSDKVSYKINDLYRGRVAEVASKTFNIAENLTFKLDRQCYTLLNKSVATGGAYGAFSTEQTRTNKQDRIFLAHSGIVTAHLPITNAVVNGSDQLTRLTVRYYDPPSTTLTGLRPAVLAAIVDYADSWANVLPGGGRLQPTGEIICPASDIIKIATAMAPSSNVLESRIQEEVNRNGYTSIQYLGRVWKFIADVTIPVSTCYPRFNLLPGRVYFKPFFDKEFVKSDEDLNLETRWQRKVYGAYIISQYRIRGLKVTYA